MEIDIYSVMDHLKNRRKVFCSEADFQFEMALVIKELYPSFKIRMEYRPRFDRKMRIDILLVSDTGWIPIELKYKTKQCEIEVNNETYMLSNHSAKDINCYLYLKDIQRIEQIKKCAPSFVEGYTVMLTNEPAYLRTPNKRDCIYMDFFYMKGQ